MVESDLSFVSRSMPQGFLFSLYDTGIASIDKAGFWEPPVFDEMASGAYWTMGDSFIAEMPGGSPFPAFRKTNCRHWNDPGSPTALYAATGKNKC